MATFTLAQLKEDVSKKYEPTTIENGDDAYVLPNFFQMTSEQRKEVQNIISEIGNDDDEDYDINEIYDRLLTAATEDEKGEELVELLGDNLALKAEIANTWMESVQAGEV